MGRGWACPSRQSIKQSCILSCSYHTHTHTHGRVASADSATAQMTGWAFLNHRSASVKPCVAPCAWLPASKCECPTGPSFREQLIFMCLEKERSRAVYLCQEVLLRFLHRSYLLTADVLSLRSYVLIAEVGVCFERLVALTQIIAPCSFFNTWMSHNVCVSRWRLFNIIFFST